MSVPVQAICELVYAPFNATPLLFSQAWHESMTIADLVEASGFMQAHPEILTCKVGIFSQCMTWDTPIRAGDRVELYRSLVLDPKEKRRRQAKKR